MATHKGIVTGENSSLRFDSEFEKNSYDRPDLIVFLSDALSLCSDSRGSWINQRDFWSHLTDTAAQINPFISMSNNLPDEAEIIYRRIKKIRVPEIEFDYDDDEEEGTDPYIVFGSFIDKCKVLQMALNTEGWDFNSFLDAAYGYLGAYYRIVQKIIFSPANYHLSTPAFRRSEFLQKLVRFSTLLPDCEETKFKRQRNIFRFSYLDPFALDAFTRCVESASLLCGTLPPPEERNNLDKLRIDLFLSSVQRAFTRYAYVGNTTYRVQLNRHTSELLAIPDDQISSVEEIKPIRLFEKIASYIRKQAELSPASEAYELGIRVCILGHTECSRDGREAGIEDLVFNILNWYDRLELSEEKPRLNFKLFNYINELDYSGMRRWQILNNCSKIQIGKKLGGHIAEYEIEAIDYYKQYTFTTEKLKDHIFNNDLIFILDCPWITSENYEIKRDGSLRAFSQVLSDYPYSKDVNRRQFLSQYQYFYKSPMMRRIDGQLGRILGSDTGTAGQVIRILKEPVLKRIGQYLDWKFRNISGRETIVYLFTSEKDGVDLSSVASDPITRTEKYDGKTFTIVKYSNWKTVPLTLEKQEGVRFRIHLWSIIKYISASFAYLDLRESLLARLRSSLEIDKIETNRLKSNDVNDAFLKAVDVLGIYRSVFVNFELDNSFRTITCSVRLSDGFPACLPSEYMPEFKDDNGMRWAVLAWARSLIEPLYREVIFADVNEERISYGDDAIRAAFLMNLYSNANDVQTMLFWHKYRMLEKSGHCGAIKCVFRPEMNISLEPLRDTEFSGKDFFSDKKLYDNVLYSLERSSNFSIAMERMFEKADQLFVNSQEGGSVHTGARILRNIIKVCERHDMEMNTVCFNARKAILEY